MAVYVDSLIVFGGDSAPRCFRNKPNCHMYADSLEELHAMASKIGLKRAWFQDSKTLQHYDLTPSKRALAVANGAMEHNRLQSVAKWRELMLLRYPVLGTLDTDPLYLGLLERAKAK